MIIRELRQGDRKENCHDVMLNDFAQTAVLDLATSSFSFSSSPSSSPLPFPFSSDIAPMQTRRMRNDRLARRRHRHSREEKAVYDDRDDAPAPPHSPITRTQSFSRNENQPRETYVTIAGRHLVRLQGRDLSFTKIPSAGTRNRSTRIRRQDTSRDLSEGFNR